MKAITPIRSERPNMPGYGIVDEKSGSGLLKWSWAVERVSASHNYWVATTRANGMPHCMAVWGVWTGSGFCFSTGAESVKAKNLRLNPRCVITTEKADNAVIIEGVAHETDDQLLLKAADKDYFAKYQYRLDPRLGPIFLVTPRIAFGWIEYEMTTTATRWVFK